jgi:hypothetical protein
MMMHAFVKGLLLCACLRVPVLGAASLVTDRSPPQAQHAEPLGVTLLVIANENCLGVLRVALCSWIRTDFHPTDVVLAADFDLVAIKGSDRCMGMLSCTAL